jgi:hypothetical protein
LGFRPCTSNRFDWKQRQETFSRQKETTRGTHAVFSEQAGRNSNPGKIFARVSGMETRLTKLSLPGFIEGLPMPVSRHARSK